MAMSYGNENRAPSGKFGHFFSLERLAWAIIGISTVDVLFLVFAIGVPIARANSMLSGDGDLARHLRVGGDILNMGGLFFTDPYSWTMGGQPFVPYEWGSEVLVALANMIGGLPAVLVLTGLVVAFTNLLVVFFLRRSGVDPLFAVLAGLAAAMVGALHWRARPHIWSPLGALATIWLLERGNMRRVWLFFPLFVIWVNLHGGFIFGLGLVALYLAGDLVECLFSAEKQHWLSRAKYHSAALIVAFIGSCVNPTGLSIFSHVTGYFGKKFLVDTTQEYQSPDFHVLAVQLFLGLLLLVVLALAINVKRPSWPHLLLIVVNLAFSLYSVRNIPLFVVTALPIVVIGFDEMWRKPAITRHYASIIAEIEQRGLVGLWSVIGAILMVYVAFNHGMIGSVQLLPTQFVTSDFPVAAVEAAKTADLKGKLFNDFAWGGYILYAWPEQKVFIDGQTDFYGEELTREYAKIRDLGKDWRDELLRREINLVVIRTESILARELPREPGWKIWYEDKTATILTHE
jgi:hypothetical protein